MYIYTRVIIRAPARGAPTGGRGATPVPRAGGEVRPPQGGPEGPRRAPAKNLDTCA